MKTPKEFLGRWRMVKTELWRPGTLDLVVPAHITFGDTCLGHFEMIAVQGEIDCRFENGRVDFSWMGDDDGEPSNGRGWATVSAEPGTIEGRIYFHQGDDSGFLAKHETAPKKAPSRAAKRRQ